MRHLLFVAILGAGFIGFSATSSAKDFSNNAYMGPSIVLQNGKTLNLRNSGITSQYTRSLRVSDLQRQLNMRGANLAVDGIWGPKTSAAVSAFQAANQLPVTGTVDAVTFDIISGSL